MALRLRGGSGVDPRQAAYGDQQEEEPAVHLAGRRPRIGRVDAAADVGQEQPRREVSRRCVREQGRGRRLRLDRGAAARRAVRRERGRGAAQRRQRPHQGRSADALPPGDEGRAGGTDRHGHRQPARGRARHHLGDDHLPHPRRDLDRPLLPALAGDPADRYPGRDGNGDGVCGGPAGVRLPQLVDGLPGLDHHRQRNQLRDHIDVALRGAPGARQRSRGGAALRAGRDLARDAGRVDRGVSGLRLADGDQLPRLLPVRRDGRGGSAVLLARDLFGSSGDVDAARSAPAWGGPSPAPRAAGVRPAGPLPPASRRRGHRGVRGARGRERLWPAPLPPGPVRIRFSQAQREAGHDPGGEAVQQEPQ